MKGAPRPNKSAGLRWAAPRNPGLSLMTECLTLLMGLIGQAWTTRAGMLYSIIDEVLSGCPADSDLGAAGAALEGPYHAMCSGTADTSPPLVQAVLRLENEYSAAFVLSLKHACAELPETHPLRLALVDLDSHARVFGPTDSYWWLRTRFLAHAAPPVLDESALFARQ